MRKLIDMSGDAIAEMVEQRRAILHQVAVQKRNDLRTAAFSGIPETIGSERWVVGDCGCDLHRIYLKDNPEVSQTFKATPCAAHAGLSLAELHDTIEEETQRRAKAHREHERLFGDATVTFEWTSNRDLIVNSSVSSPTLKALVANRVEVRGNNGAMQIR